MKTLFLATITAFTFMAVSCEQKKEDSTEIANEVNEEKLDDTKMEDDAEFAVAAANGGMLEVKLGELAQTNGSAAAVKEFGAMMVKDHGAANEELKTVAQSQNITLPTGLDKDAQDMYDDLAAKKGTDFDRAYVDMMEEDHGKDINKFEEEANDGNNAALKAFAAKTLPTLKMHKEKIEGIKKSM